MLRLQRVDFLWLSGNFKILSRNSFRCEVAPQAKIFGLRKLRSFKSNPKKINVLEKGQEFFAFQLAGMLSIMLIFWQN